MTPNPTSHGSLPGPAPSGRSARTHRSCGERDRGCHHMECETMSKPKSKYVDVGLFRVRFCATGELRVHKVRDDGQGWRRVSLESAAAPRVFSYARKRLPESARPTAPTTPGGPSSAAGPP